VTTGDDRVTVYRRRGCAFCAVLRRRLRRAGLDVVERDIWEDPEAAAFVRRHAGGNETVPTVDVAGTVLVNPSADRVLALARERGLAEPAPPGRRRRR
jgi:glutaredoxin